MISVLHGVLPVLHTPYLDNGKIDFEPFGKEVDFAFETGANGVVLAMVSEVLRLSFDERKALAVKAVEFTGGRGSVTVSVGAESTMLAIELAEHAASIGASALMVIPPVATGLDESGLREYYASVLGSTDLPLVVQDASSYVGQPMSAEFQIRLWEEFGDRIGFKPESAPVGPVVSAINAATGGKAKVFEGSGGTMLVENFRRGIAGTMPGTDLLDAIVELWKALQAGDENRTYAISTLVSSILALAVGLDGYLAIEKYLLCKRGIFKNQIVRGPSNFALDGPAIEELERLYGRLQRVLNLS